MKREQQLSQKRDQRQSPEAEHELRALTGRGPAWPGHTGEGHKGTPRGAGLTAPWQAGEASSLGSSELTACLRTSVASSIKLPHPASVLMGPLRMTRLDAGKGQTEVSAWQVMSPLQAAGRKWPQDTKQQGGQEQSQGALGEDGRQLNSQEHQAFTCSPSLLVGNAACPQGGGWCQVFLEKRAAPASCTQVGASTPLAHLPHTSSVSLPGQNGPQRGMGGAFQWGIREGLRDTGPRRAGEPPCMPDPVLHVAGGQERLSLRSPLWELLTGKAGEQQHGCPVKSSRQPALRDRLCSPMPAPPLDSSSPPPRLHVLPQGIGRSPSTCPGLMDREGQ